LLQHAITSALETIGPSPFEKGLALSIKQASRALDKPAKSLEDSLIKFLFESVNSTRDYRNAFKEEDWLQLERFQGTLKDYKQEIPFPEFQISTLQDISKNIINMCTLKSAMLPEEYFNDLSLNAKELSRNCCLILLNQASDAILTMDYQIRALREYVTFHTGKIETRKVCLVSHLVSQAIFNLQIYAKNEKVEIKRFGQTGSAELYCDERSVVRALINLLHNAIKYSWIRLTRDKDGRLVETSTSPSGEELGPKWIRIETKIAGDQVIFEIEDFGLAIPKDELDLELIFISGFRGRLSSKRWERFGTGIGLTDARETARKHGGDLTIESRPAVHGAKDDDYSKPFITTAILKLPLYKR
jgi:signal transduction histidine kinase